MSWELAGKVARAALVVLAMVSALIYFGRSSFDLSPSAYSYEPGGTHAFVELLRQSGIEVKVTRSILSTKSDKELYIAFVPADALEYHSNYVLSRDQGTDVLEVDETQYMPWIDPIENGGRAIFFLTPTVDRFTTALPSAGLTPIESAVDARKYTVSSGATEYGLGNSISIFDDELPIWESPSGSFVSDFRCSSGSVILVSSSAPARNAYIQEADNAAFCVELVKRYVPKGGRVVVLEAAHGNAEQPSLMEYWGGWAVMAWRQVMIIGFLAIVFFGVRFGLPESERFKQSGGKELKHAVVEIYSRAKARDVALGSIVDSQLQRLRRAGVISSGRQDENWQYNLPEALQAIFATAAVSSQSRDNSKNGATTARRLIDAVDHFLEGRKQTFRHRA